jgi:hypothetical protein
MPGGAGQLDKDTDILTFSIYTGTFWICMHAWDYKTCNATIAI